jgi:hypothetical protein
MNSSVDLSTLPVWLLAIGGLVVLAQLSFEIWVLVTMVNTPSDQITLGGRKWLWAIIILLVNWIGAIIFLVAGRKPVAVAEAAPVAAAATRAEAAADVLYGVRNDSPVR